MSNEKNLDGWSFGRRPLLYGAAALMVIAFVTVMGLSYLKTVPPRESGVTSETGSVSAVKVEAGCQLIQTLRYTPCGHQIVRRLEGPQELIGKNREDVEAVYDQWRITAFAAGEIEMAQELAIHCPRHVVLMPDTGGVLGIFENKYGDALAFVRSVDTELSSLPEAVQEELRPGKGFDSVNELEQWLESVES